MCIRDRSKVILFKLQRLPSKKKLVLTPKTKTNTQPNEFFMCHHKHVGNGYKAEQNYRPLAKTLTMQWMLLKKIIQH